MFVAWSVTASSQPVPLTASEAFPPANAPPLPQYLLLHRMSGFGLQVEVLYPRTASLYSKTMVAVRMRMQNFLQEPINEIQLVSSRIAEPLATCLT